MKKFIIIFIQFIFIFAIAFNISIYASPNMEHIKVKLEMDSTYFRKNQLDFDEININISPSSNIKHFQIAPIFASRKGVELNLIYSGTITHIKFLKEDNASIRLVREMFSHSYSYISFKYLPGNDDIHSYTFDKNPYKDTNVSFLGEKTRQSFALGFKSTNLWGNSKLPYGPGLSTGWGLVLENKVHHYLNSVTGQYLGFNDEDVHFYFEVEPQLETKYTTIGVNYNTYFHQFAFMLGYKF
ncbi:MAG: hypothetical protein HY934_05010 [Candidatus Firestonebacteria bacterium]|nr:hypothetical protein [Candidatus Firestonebacteria bacterium]